MKLISMTDYVQNRNEENKGMKVSNIRNNHSEYYMQCLRYANFLKRPLKLEMFVPCDEEGNVLEDPLDVNCLKHGSCTCGEEAYNDCRDWKHELRIAKEKVLFEGLNIIEGKRKGGYYIVGINELTLWLTWNQSKTIESLIQNNLTLTPSAIKQFN